VVVDRDDSQCQSSAFEQRRPQSRGPSGPIGLAGDNYARYLLCRPAAGGSGGCEPHASPIFHAIQYLLGNQTREKLEAFRGYRERNPIPQTIDPGQPIRHLRTV
jgi:hypothetical protein